MPSLDWKRLDSRYVVHDDWFMLDADIYRLPDERVDALLSGEERRTGVRT